ncbi:hypothetical protein DL98DRAFT_661541 [Cadophora sp. DSE1049]|nr:hypothetical protein DL98DRAFT_661541 [Cadophora sp. DSE1049]
MASNTSIRTQLIGAWELISYCAYKVDDPSERIFPLGPEAQGMIMYTPSGHMSAQLRRPGQPHFATGDGITSGTDSEWAEVGRNYVAYTGCFFLDETGGSEGEPMLLHEMRYSNIPRLVGDVQRRLVEIKDESDGRYLYLGVKEIFLGGEKRVVRVKWKRMEQNSEENLPVKL